MPALSDAGEANPRLSVFFSGIVLCVFGYAIAESFQWPDVVRLFPRVFSIPGVLLAGVCIVRDWREARAGRPVVKGGAPPATVLFGLSREVERSIWFFLWLTALLPVTLVFGQHAALVGFVAFYLLVWGHYRWSFALTYAALGLAFLVGMFDFLSPTVWYPAVFDVTKPLVDVLRALING